jgi:hypothetical protein
MFNPIKPPLFRAHYCPPTPDDGGIVPNNSVPHTTAALNRSDLAIEAVAEAASASSTPPYNVP